MMAAAAKARGGHFREQHPRKGDRRGAWLHVKVEEASGRPKLSSNEVSVAAHFAEADVVQSALAKGCCVVQVPLSSCLTPASLQG
jgi:hypothetical protein